MAAKMFKPGDEVLVRKDLERGVVYGEIRANTEMMSYRGKGRVIKSLKEGYGNNGKGIFYELVGCPWFWTDEMFAPVPDDEELEDSGYSISYLFGGTGEGK